MTYLGFHLTFILPPILLLILLQKRIMAEVGALRAWALIGLVCLIAFIYTVPWDNYLVYRGVWGYGDDRVLGTIGYVPVEEYLFFLLQPILTGLWYYRIMDSSRTALTAPPWVRPALALFWMAVAVAGALLLATTSGLYLGLILAWAAPVLSGMAWLCGDRFWRRRREWALGIGVPTLYLWIADRTAIASGIWHISETYTLGPAPFGLPVEEAVFFLLTNVLVVQGLMMFLFSNNGSTRSAIPDGVARGSA